MELSFKLLIRAGINGLNMKNDNVDVEVHFPKGESYVATFFTLNNIQSLFEKNAKTGERKNGLYFWCSDMIIVKELTESVIRETVEDLLLKSGEFEEVFLKKTE